MGDRRDYFETHEDVWEMFLLVLDGRKRREIDPTIAILRECVDQVSREGRSGKEIEVRLQNMLEFFEQTDKWYAQLRRLPRAGIIKFIRLGSKVMPTAKASR